MLDAIRAMKKQRQKQNQIKEHFAQMVKWMNDNESTSHCLAMTIKQVHAIEKGLSMKELRLGFGLPRISLMLDYVEKYISLSSDTTAEELTMAWSVLSKYTKLHDDRGFTNEEYVRMKDRIQHVFQKECSEMAQGESGGGTLCIYPNSSGVSLNEFTELVNSRHSIREFKHEPVDEVRLKNALELAMKAPSACNRQSTRVYILDHKDFDVISQWTGGVKTFLHTVDKLLIVTGQMSAYEKDEYFQYSVSAGIFTGYLTLSLHAVGIGACVLQRPLLMDSQWEQVSSRLGIPKDEQVVCSLAIGVPEDCVKVPQSYRLPYERIVHRVE